MACSMLSCLQNCVHLSDLKFATTIDTILVALVRLAAEGLPSSNREFAVII